MGSQGGMAQFTDKKGLNWREVIVSRNSHIRNQGSTLGVLGDREFFARSQ